MPGDPLRASGSWLFGFASKPICLLKPHKGGKDYLPFTTHMPEQTEIDCNALYYHSVIPGKAGMTARWYYRRGNDEGGVPHILLLLPSKTLLQRKTPCPQEKPKTKL